jgi:hypothetical protein
MIFILLENNQIIHYGPVEYNRNRFRSFLENDLEISFDLPNTLSDTIIINENVKIIKAELVYPVNFNSKIQEYSGPFWDFSNPDLAIGTYGTADRNIDFVKSDLKSLVANNRWKKETSGMTLTVQGIEIFVTTERGERDIYLQALQLGADNKNWKFVDKFLTLSLQELGYIVTAVVTHVQNAFDRESEIVSLIENATTLTELDNIDIGFD